MHCTRRLCRRKVLLRWWPTLALLPTLAAETALIDGTEEPPRCREGYYQRDPIAFSCDGGHDRQMTMLTAATTPQGTFYWRAPAGTQDLRLEATLKLVQPSPHSGATLRVWCEGGDRKLLVGADSGALNQKRRSIHINGAHWAWSGDVEINDGRLFTVWLRINGSLSCDVEATLSNTHSVPLVVHLNYSWTSVSPCPHVAWGCKTCPKDKCHEDEEAFCNGSPYWECVAVHPSHPPIWGIKTAAVRNVNNDHNKMAQALHSASTTKVNEKQPNYILVKPKDEPGGNSRHTNRPRATFENRANSSTSIPHVITDTAVLDGNTRIPSTTRESTTAADTTGSTSTSEASMRLPQPDDASISTISPTAIRASTTITSTTLPQFTDTTSITTTQTTVSTSTMTSRQPTETITNIITQTLTTYTFSTSTITISTTLTSITTTSTTTTSLTTLPFQPLVPISTSPELVSVLKTPYMRGGTQDGRMKSAAIPNDLTSWRITAGALLVAGAALAGIVSVAFLLIFVAVRRMAAQQLEQDRQQRERGDRRAHARSRGNGSTEGNSLDAMPVNQIFGYSPLVMAEQH